MAVDRSARIPNHMPIIDGSMTAGEICAEQYLYWQCRGWTHHEMLTAIERPHVTGMTGDDIVGELSIAWQSLNRTGCDR